MAFGIGRKLKKAKRKVSRAFKKATSFVEKTFLPEWVPDWAKDYISTMVVPGAEFFDKETMAINAAALASVFGGGPAVIAGLTSAATSTGLAYANGARGDDLWRAAAQGYGGGAVGAGAGGLAGPALGGLGGRAGAGLASGAAGAASGAAAAGAIGGNFNSNAVWQNALTGGAGGLVAGGLGALTSNPYAQGVGAGAARAAIGGGSTQDILFAGAQGAANAGAQSAGAQAMPGNFNFNEPIPSIGGTYNPAFNPTAPTVGADFAGGNTGYTPTFNPTGGGGGQSIGSQLLGFLPSVLNAGLQLYGANQASDASRDASQAQIQAAREANALQLAIYQQQRQDQAPFRDIGAASLGTLAGQLAPGGEWSRGFTMADYQQDPGYEFRMSEGLKAIERSGAARGGALSGGALKDLTRFSQGTASEEYGNAYNRYWNDRSNRFNQYASLAGLGQTATNQTNAAAGNYAQGAQQNIVGAGDARGAGIVGSSNAWNQALGNIGSNIQDQYTLNRLFPRG